jgi:hypothetical protein
MFSRVGRWTTHTFKHPHLCYILHVDQWGFHCSMSSGHHEARRGSSILDPTTRGERGNPGRTRRAIGSTESFNHPTPVVGSSSRIEDSIPPVQIVDLNSQGTLQYSHPILEDIFENIQYVEVDFVYRLIQNGVLKFIQQTYNTDTLWTSRDCRIQRTSPNGESFKEFSKCLSLILKVPKLYSVKTLQTELLKFMVKQLPFLIGRIVESITQRI